MINIFCRSILIVSIFIQLSTGTITTFKDIEKLLFNSSKFVKDDILQLECKSNEELCKFMPKTIDCVNLNFKKDTEPKFECKSQPVLNENVSFDDRQIICSFKSNHESILKSEDKSIQLDSCRFLFKLKFNSKFEKVLDEKIKYVKAINGNNESKSKKKNRLNLLYFILIGAISSILIGLILGFLSLLVFKKSSTNKKNLIYDSETPPLTTISSQVGTSYR